MYKKIITLLILIILCIPSCVLASPDSTGLTNYSGKPLNYTIKNSIVKGKFDFYSSQSTIATSSFLVKDGTFKSIVTSDIDIARNYDNNVDNINILNTIPASERSDYRVDYNIFLKLDYNDNIIWSKVFAFIFDVTFDYYDYYYFYNYKGIELNDGYHVYIDDYYNYKGGLYNTNNELVIENRNIIVVFDKKTGDILSIGDSSELTDEEYIYAAEYAKVLKDNSNDSKIITNDNDFYNLYFEPSNYEDGKFKLYVYDSTVVDYLNEITYDKSGNYYKNYGLYSKDYNDTGLENIKTNVIDNYIKAIDLDIGELGSYKQYFVSKPIYKNNNIYLIIINNYSEETYALKLDMNYNVIYFKKILEDIEMFGYFFHYSDCFTILDNGDLLFVANGIIICLDSNGNLKWDNYSFGSYSDVDGANVMTNSIAIPSNYDDLVPFVYEYYKKNGTNTSNATYDEYLDFVNDYRSSHTESNTRSYLLSFVDIVIPYTINTLDEGSLYLLGMSSSFYSSSNSLSFLKYDLIFDTISKSSEYGDIEIVNSSKAGELVTVKIKNNNSTLKANYLNVKTELGNSINVNKVSDDTYTFIMPTSAVTVEAIRVSNPKTGIQTVAYLIPIVASVWFIFNKYKNKKEVFKKI